MRPLSAPPNVDSSPLLPLLCYRMIKPSQILLPRRGHPIPKDRALNLHIDLIKWTHNSLDPVLIDLCKELLYRFFSLRRGRVCCYRGAGARGARGGGLEGGMEEEEFDVWIGL